MSDQKDRSDATPPAEVEAEKLPDLTPKQAAFVNGILEGLSASDAYRRAYDSQDMQPRTIWAEASRVRSNRNVAAWLAAARRAGLGTATVTLNGHLSELERLKQLAIDQGEIKTAVDAEKARGKAAGLYVDRSEVTINNPAAILAEISALDPALAHQIAERYSLPLSSPVIEHQPADQQDD